MTSLFPPVSRLCDQQRPQTQYVPANAGVKPVVSVITPFYNTGALFEQTASSLNCQSLQQWEWFIVNDVSDDPVSISLLGAMRDKDPRITIVDQTERRGPSAARNVAARLTQAPYLFFLDSDDLIESTALEKMVWCLESHPEWAMCKGYTVAFGAQSYFSRACFEDAWLFLDRNPVTLTAAVRRAAFDAVGGFDEEMRSGHEDWDLWLRFASHGYWGHTIPEPLDWYRRRSTHTDRWRLWTNRGIHEVRCDLRRAYPSLYRRGIDCIPERDYEPSHLLRMDAAFDNVLVPRRRALILLSGSESYDQVAEVAGPLVCSDVAVTIAMLGSVAGEGVQSLERLVSEAFIMSRFLHPEDYRVF